MIKILYLAAVGAYFVCSMSSLMSSIFLWLAASISMISIWRDSFAITHCAQTSQGLEVGPFSQTKAFANILALDVLPLPLRPENK
jgi:hypothetical protein